MVNTWLINSTKNLLPLSVSKDFTEAIKSEWFFEGVAYDLGYPSVDCQLCNHEAIRYQFQIHNQLTDNTLLIGSSCIQRFGIKYKNEDGTTYTMDATMREVKKSLKQAIIIRKKYCKNRAIDDLNLLRKNIREDNINVISFIDAYEKFGMMTPRQLAFIISLFEQYNILYDISNFVVSTRNKKQIDDISNINDVQYNRIVGALTPKQKNLRIKKAA
jgi:hypothetical protein